MDVHVCTQRKEERPASHAHCNALQQEAQMHVNMLHTKGRRSYLQALQEGGGCIARCAAYQDFSPQFGAELVGHPHLAPGHTSHHKGHNALPLQHARVSPSLSIIANSKRSRSHLPLQWLQYGSPATCISPPCRLRVEWCHRANSVCAAARKP